MDKKGITLIELVVVLSVVIILVASAGFSYENWLGNYEVECETKELYADLMRARVMAIQKDRKHFFTWDSASYAIFEDKNEDGDADAGEELPSFPKKVKRKLQSNFTTISLNTRGLLSQGTAHFDLTGSGLSPDYDCVTASRTRIRIGKYDGTNCRSD